MPFATQQTCFLLEFSQLHVICSWGLWSLKLTGSLKTCRGLEVWLIATNREIALPAHAHLIIGELRCYTPTLVGFKQQKIIVRGILALLSGIKPVQKMWGSEMIWSALGFPALSHCNDQQGPVKGRPIKCGPHTSRYLYYKYRNISGEFKSRWGVPNWKIPQINSGLWICPYGAIRRMSIKSHWSENETYEMANITDYGGDLTNLSLCYEDWKTLFWNLEHCVTNCNYKLSPLNCRLQCTCTQKIFRVELHIRHQTVNNSCEMQSWYSMLAFA